MQNDYEDFGPFDVYEPVSLRKKLIVGIGVLLMALMVALWVAPAFADIPYAPGCKTFADVATEAQKTDTQAMIVYPNAAAAKKYMNRLVELGMPFHAYDEMMLINWGSGIMTSIVLLEKGCVTVSGNIPTPLLYAHSPV